MREYIEKYWYETVWGIVGLIGASGIISLGSNVADMASAHPVPLASVIAVSLSIGAFVGWSAHKAKMRRESDAEAGPGSADQPVQPDSLGLSPMASDAWSKVDDPYRRAFSILCGCSAIGGDGKPSQPLVFDLDDRKLAAIGLSVADLEMLRCAGLVNVNDSPYRKKLVGVAEGAPEAEVEPGVWASGKGAAFDLHDGRFGIGLCECAVGKAGDFSAMIECVDLGLVDFTPIGLEVAGKVEAGHPAGFRQYAIDAYASSRERRREALEVWRSVPDR